MNWRLDFGQIEVVDDAVAEVLRHKTVTQRLAMVFAAHRMARMLIEGSLRSTHPDWSEDQIRSQASRRLLGTK